jgi:hypothetical protein
MVTGSSMKSSFFKRNLIDLIAILLLIVLSLCLFRSAFTGYIWVGNPDRLNSDLKITRHYLSLPTVNAWDQNEMMGYDSFSLPYIYPSVLVSIIKLLGATEEITVMGFLTIVLLSLAGISSYYCIRSITNPGLPAITGAICYQFSSLTILKVSQNALSFAVFIIFPLAILCLHRISRKNMINQFLFLSILLSLMLGFMFLQKAAYILITIGLYACWKSFVQKKYSSLFVFCGALIIAAVFSGPRIVGIFSAMQEYSRLVPGLDIKSFDNLYTFQNIRPYEILRWFDNGLFGFFPSQASAVHNNINLNEGFLIYTSSVVPWLLVFGLMFSLTKLRRIQRPVSDLPFFGFILICSILVITCKSATQFIYVLFLKMDFTHARILIAGLLPLCILVAATLKQLESGIISKNTPPSLSKKVILFGIGIISAFILNAVIEGQVSALANTYIFNNDLQLNIYKEALKRIQLSLEVFVILLLFLLIKRIPLTLRKIAFVILCGFISMQCFLAANRQVNGEQVFNFQRPFYMGDMYYATHDEFSTPTPRQIQQLHKRLTPQSYRVALVCDSHLANGFCAGHVPEYWNLRAIDGYYGMGVPTRLARLPWKTEAGLRTLSFSNVDEIPWDLLGFLNVKHVLVVGNGIYRNIEVSKDHVIKKPDPGDFKIIESKARVTPRAFFVSKLVSVKSMQEAVEKIFQKNQIVDPQQVSFVENLQTTNLQTTTTNNEVKIEGQGDHLFVRFNASSHTRFLVLNELYYPGWAAEGNGKKLKIYPTNIVMRGIVVPPGIDSITLTYTSISSTSKAKMIREAMILLLCLIFLVTRKNQHKKEPV